jgi:hypothetical protein
MTERTKDFPELSKEVGFVLGLLVRRKLDRRKFLRDECLYKRGQKSK